MQMPAPYSSDLRQRVIDADKSKEESFRQLADRFQVSLSFVQRLINRYKNTGLVAPKSHGGGAAAKLTAEDLPIVQQLVNEQPDALLSELCDAPRGLARSGSLGGTKCIKNQRSDDAPCSSSFRVNH